jgi:hypothetical protein
MDLGKTHYESQWRMGEDEFLAQQCTLVQVVMNLAFY